MAKKKRRLQPHPDDLRDLLRRNHRTLMALGGDYAAIPGKRRWQALEMAHEIAETLRMIGNGVDDPMPPKEE
jgi:hypothetical protein